MTAAGVQDSTAGRALLEQSVTEHPSLREVWVDGGYRRRFVKHAATLDINLETIQREPWTREFSPIPKSLGRGRTHGWLMLHRRLARRPRSTPAPLRSDDPPGHPDLMARRLTGETTVSWRDPTSADEIRITG